MPFPNLKDQLSQAYPPKPGFTEKDLPQLSGKVSISAFGFSIKYCLLTQSQVYIITGANTGVGKELAQMLYSKNAKVYIVARSETKAQQAIEDIKKAEPTSSGELVFLRLDLADLSTIKASAQEFLDKETKLHVLFNNAGVMKPEPGAKSAQGYELQLGVNNIGTFMFTKLLTPIMAATAKSETPGTVRVVWVGSSGGEMPVTPRGGVPMDNLDYHDDVGWFPKYCISKAGNYLHGAEYARRHTAADGILSIALNPGNLDSDLWRTQPWAVAQFLKWFVLHESINGAYTELYAGLSPEVSIDRSGGWVVPWGRFMNPRADLLEAKRTKDEGGSGIAREFWEWNEEQIRPYL
jgi:NAD(P)-dependent dehydrogenase (short-subunit alcohol dehydrogenase family)